MMGTKKGGKDGEIKLKLDHQQEQQQAGSPLELQFGVVILRCIG